MTEGRSAFLPWLWWNWAKQDWPNRELVVVGPDLPAWLAAERGVRAVACEPGLRVAVKRNVALDHAAGRFVAWMDDDDWQHPRRLTALTGEGVVRGGSRSWFVDLRSGRARPFQRARGVLFNGLVAPRWACPRFNEALVRAADTPWMRQLAAPVEQVPGVWSAWLCHGLNISNPASRFQFPERAGAVALEVGEEAWAGTDAELAALRDRLAIN